MTSRRLAEGGTWIDRSHPIRFTFGGVEYEGFQGDTLASALLANGVDAGFRSPILGRPRGIYSAGSEEPNAFVQVSAPRFDAIVPATTVELVDGLAAERRAGVGRLPIDPEAVPVVRCVHRHAHVETLVVLSGEAGMAVSSEDGDRVLVFDERPRADDLSLPEDVTVLPRTTALGVYDEGYVLAHERSRPVERLWHVRAGRVILATGAHERPIAFAGNDLPGVMLAGAARVFVERFGVLPGERAVVFTTNDAALDTAAVLREAGVDIVAVADVRGGSTVQSVEGDGHVTRVRIAAKDAIEAVDADLVLVSGGWNPAVGLWRAIGGGLRYDESLACFVPEPGTGPEWLSVVGAAAGTGLPTNAPYWFVPSSDYSKHFVDLQRDQTVADVAAALEGGLRSVEHVKRATYIGTAVDQGRTSGVLAAEIVNLLRGEGPGAQGPTNARPPTTPVSFAALAGLDRGSLLDPARLTSIHPWHVEHDALFENVGQWKRPWSFLAEGESFDEAVHRECLAVRTGVGVMDASTLGKIEVVGPDAPAFLDRMYTNRMSNLSVGSIRYGLMLGLDGMVFDDGVAMRLADDRYLVTTTTGGAARVLDHFEEWLQTEWTDLRVSCTSVTEQWAVAAINGPRARELVAAMGTDIDLSKDAFPFMTWREGMVARVPTRLARVSFSGELAYELHVAWWHGRAIWEAAMAAGARLNITPYGTEAMHVLRAEKGYVIVGQDTDGTVTPRDLGMSWIVNDTKGDFVGKRSLRRPDTMRPDRKQLVGLMPEAPLTEGAPLVSEDTVRIPMPMVGHVTSAYVSPVLDLPFALAMLRSGSEMHGAIVYAPLPEGTIRATVTSPIFYDPEGTRREG